MCIRLQSSCGTEKEFYIRRLMRSEVKKILLQKVLVILFNVKITCIGTIQHFQLLRDEMVFQFHGVKICAVVFVRYSVNSEQKAHEDDECTLLMSLKQTVV